MKKRLKKLALNRETLRTLEGAELPKVNGAATQIPRRCTEASCTCISWCYQCITDEPTACVAC
jgi:hypothetical protein